MPFFKIEPSGCCERKGMVQVRLAFYLEPGDFGYEKHFVDVPVFPKEPYAGKKEDYAAWVATLPTKKQLNPFHNHLMLVEPDTSKEAIIAIGDKFLKEAFGFWEKEKTPALKNSPVVLPKVVDSKRLANCELAVVSAKAIDVKAELEKIKVAK